MDFLGLRTLSIIERGRELVQQTLDEKTIRKTVRPDDSRDWDQNMATRSISNACITTIRTCLTSSVAVKRPACSSLNPAVCATF